MAKALLWLCMLAACNAVAMPLSAGSPALFKDSRLAAREGTGLVAGCAGRESGGLRSAVVQYER